MGYLVCWFTSLMILGIRAEARLGGIDVYPELHLRPGCEQE